MPTPAPHYDARVTFTAGGDEPRRAVVAALGDAVRQRASEPTQPDALLELAVAGGAVSVDLAGTEPELRAHRLRHLANALTVQRSRPTFPDTIAIVWSKAP